MIVQNPRVKCFEDYAERSQDATTVDGLRSVFDGALTAEGYENHILTSIAERKIGAIAWHSLPRAYPETYFSQQWEKIDPIVGLSLRARDAFSWNDAHRWTPLNQKQKTFMAESRQLKVHSGVTFPMHGPGGRCDIISISRRERDLADPRRLSLLKAMCTQTWWRYLDLTVGTPIVPMTEGARLTNREIEILRWIRDGKSNPDIAEILPIRIKTVEFHVSNILRKLDATNRVTAVVIALQSGLLRA